MDYTSEIREEILRRGWFTEKQLATCEHNANSIKKTEQSVVKLFNAIGGGTWYITEVDEDMYAFGMCHIFEAELGIVYLGELLEADKHGQAMIQRDRYVTLPKSWEGVRQQIREYQGLDRLEERYA
tara:strand:+ start:1626 stop:2003 length:378 start_codon:yes stop_codon:yes gene_type:complete